MMERITNKNIALGLLVIMIIGMIIILAQLTTIAGYESYVQDQLKGKICYDSTLANQCLINKCQKLEPFNISNLNLTSAN